MDPHYRAALASLAATLPRALRGIEAGFCPSNEDVRQICLALLSFAFVAKDEEIPLLVSRLPPLLLQLLIHAISLQHPPLYRSAADRLQGGISRVLASCLSAHAGNNNKPPAVTLAAERLASGLLRTQSLRWHSRLLHEAFDGAAGPAWTDVAVFSTHKGSLVTASKLASSSLLLTSALLSHTFERMYDPSSTSVGRGNGGRPLAMLTLHELSASQVLEHAAWALLHLKSAVGRALRLQASRQDALEVGALLNTSLPNLKEAIALSSELWVQCLRSASSPSADCSDGSADECADDCSGGSRYPSLRASRSNGSRAVAVQAAALAEARPWGPCLQHLLLVHAVTALAATGHRAAACPGGVTLEKSSSAGRYGGRLYGLPEELAESVQVLRWRPANQNSRHCDPRPSPASTAAAVPPSATATSSDGGSGGDGGGSTSGASGLPAPPPLLYLDQAAFLPLLRLLETELEVAAVRRGGSAPGTQPGAGPACAGAGLRPSGAEAGRSSESRQPPWSFIIPPRAAYRLCMRVAGLAVESACACGQRGEGSGDGPGPADCRAEQRGQGSEGSGGGALQPQGMLLRADVAWCVAARALVAARWLRLLHANHSAGGAGAGAGDGGHGAALSGEWWCTVAALLRTDPPIANVPDGGAQLPFSLPEVLDEMLRIPVEEWPALEPGCRPPPALSTALSCGIIPAMERALRHHAARGDGLTIATQVLLPSVLQCNSRQLVEHCFLHNLLAFGPPRQVAALLVTVGKLLQRAAGECEAASARGKAGSSSGGVLSVQGQEQEQELGRREGGRGEAEGAECPEACHLRALLSNVVYAMPDPDEVMEFLGSANADGSHGNGSAGSNGRSIEAVAPFAASAEAHGPADAQAHGTAPPEALHEQRQRVQRLFSMTLHRWLPALQRCVLALPDDPVFDVAAFLAAMHVLRYVPAMLVATRGNGERGGAWSALFVPPAGTGRASCLDPVALLDFALSRIVRVAERALQIQQVEELLDALVMTAVVFPDRVWAGGLRGVRAGARGSGSASGGGGSGGGGGVGPGYCWSPEALAALAGLREVREDPDLRDRVDAVAAAVEGVRAGGMLTALDLVRMMPTTLAEQQAWSRLLLPPAEAAEGLLRACGNPRCACLEGDSEAELEGGLSKCGGCGAVWYCCRDCQRAHWREGHRGECAARHRRSGGA